MNENNTSFFLQYRTLNLVMLWLTTLTALLLLVPLTDFAPSLAALIEGKETYLIFALIAGLSNFIAQFIGGLISRKAQRRRTALISAHLQQAVDSLDFAERALLREFVLQRKSVLTLPITEPTVRSLLDSGILKAVNVPTDEDNMYALAIAKAARPYITYRAIGLSRGRMSEEAISQIMAARPDYARPHRVIQHAYRGGMRRAA